MTKKYVLLAILATSLSSTAGLLPLESENYTVTVTKEVTHPKVSSPFEKIPDEQYLPTKKKETMSLKFSKDRKKVTILPREISGELAKVDNNKRVYKLGKGLFAGGRLVVEKTKNGLVSTFTEFGSRRSSHLKRTRRNQTDCSHKKVSSPRTKIVVSYESLDTRVMNDELPLKN